MALVGQSHPLTREPKRWNKLENFFSNKINNSNVFLNQKFFALKMNGSQSLAAHFSDLLWMAWDIGFDEMMITVIDEERCTRKLKEATLEECLYF